MNSKTALVIMDMQEGNFIGDDAIYAGKDLLIIASYILQKARDAGIPVIYVLNNGGAGEPDEVGTSGWQVHPDIKPNEKDILIQKTTPDAFHKTTLKDTLERLGIENLVIMGLQTEYCIDTTCRRGSLLGFTIKLVMDGHSTWDSDILSAPKIIAHHNAVLGNLFVELVNSSNFEFS